MTKEDIQRYLKMVAEVVHPCVHTTPTPYRMRKIFGGDHMLDRA